MARVRRWTWLFMAIGLLFSVGISWTVGWPEPVIVRDVVQDRIDVALPPLKDGQKVLQSLQPQHNGFSRVALTLVNYRSEDEVMEPTGRLTIQLFDERDILLTEEIIPDSSGRRNQTVWLAFPPQQDSAQQTYTLQLHGDSLNQLSAWGYSLNPYTQTELITENINSSAQTLTYTLQYQLLWRDAAQALVQQFWQYGGMMLLMMLLILGPGFLITERFYRPGWGGIVYCGVALSSGLSFWAVIWLWWTVIGGRFTGWLLALILIGTWLWWFASQRNAHAFEWLRRPAIETVLFGLFLLCVLAVRLLAVNDLAFLPWVDASRHALITAVMTESGQFLRSYEPYLPIERPLYHYGFHTLPAGVMLLSGRYWPLETVLLGMMQLLSALIPLVVYAGTWLFCRNRSAAWLAAFLVAIPFFFPAYYTTWGRLTQLTGGLVMAVLVALTWRIGRYTSQRHLWPLVALLASGLFLIHFRVFVFYIPLATVVLLLGVLAKQRVTVTWPLIKAGGIAMGVVMPQALALIRPQIRDALPGGEFFVRLSNPFPTGYVTTGWEQYFWGAAAVAALMLIIVTLKRWAYVESGLLLTVWIGLLFLFTAGDLIGWFVLLPQANLNSMYIILYLPQAMLLGMMGVITWRIVAARHWVLWAVSGTAAGGLVGILLLFGVQYQLTLLNEVTFLARSADREAIAWVAEHTPADARIAVSSWEWFPDVWAGTDSGGWLLPLTGRLTTTPPIDYSLDAQLLTQAQLFNELAYEIDDWSTRQATTFLRQQGVTHLFVGQKGGYLDPAELSRNEELDLQFANEGAYIFMVRE